MSKKENSIFKALNIVAWIIFVGLCFEAGGLIVNFFFSLFNPEFVPYLYQKLDLSRMFEVSMSAFFLTYGFLLSIAFLKANLFYKVIMLRKRIDLTKPFTNVVSNQIQQISYITLFIGFASFILGQITKTFMKHGLFTDHLHQFWTGSQAFILMGAVIYIIATIFKKGVDLQTENDLTV